ncbi:ABL101Cp [Eremothecium gossypii ATCC 10895]|uniref:ABL101Cp n=1 Tax=Eremothecium gossypii (strain ATCC 10895 / CBS 109.51 / FGSC 9923 / NRRL Y-1056) TaxID=284811 RepID=Q75DX4_EREGS|nr:ABL101Cp [Eremothecium gossypii ATCC 10895]AAS50670.1 ABL101Cp [Eremothecium gossypii ATCC 10895]AEY94958.1 FABL101Cp [Eremothecium gossypii FDAG1]
MFERLKLRFRRCRRLRANRLADVPYPNPTLNSAIIFQNRHNHGVNLGSLFVLEKWIFESMFQCGGETEHAGIRKMMDAIGYEATAERLRKHYENYMAHIDWDWLQSIGVTAVRLPVGYWHINNGMYTAGFVFDDVRLVYMSARPWDYVRALIHDASRRNIGVLIDMHGLPGGANSEHHSGEGVDASFFKSGRNMDTVCNTMIPFIVQDLRGFHNVVGLQVVNEAVYDYAAEGQKYYYERAVNAVRANSVCLPVVISDGWSPDQWSKWINDRGLSNDIVIDTHVYRCYSDDDKSKSVQQLTDDLKDTVRLDRDAADFVVGEFSCVLDADSWAKTSGDRDQLIKNFGHEQVRVFNSNANVGWFFWTYQFQHGDGGEWGFVPMVHHGNLPSRPRLSIPDVENRIRQMVSNHVSFWRDKGGDRMEHWRFEEAVRRTAADILAFDRFDHSRIGRVHYWRSVRRAQYIRERGDSDLMWEWDQGFDQAISEFNKF